MKHYFLPVLVAAALGVTANVAAAATVKTIAPPVVQPVCTISSVTTATQCQTVMANNDKVEVMNGFNLGSGVFGINDWILADKSGDNVDKTAPFNLISSPDGATSGVWSVAAFGGYTKAALVVKGGSEAFVAYLLDITKLSGNWSTQDIRNGGGKQPGLSHMSLYVSDYQEPVSPVPVPAAGLLLLGALGVFGAVSRRKRT